MAAIAVLVAMLGVELLFHYIVLRIAVPTFEVRPHFAVERYAPVSGAEALTIPSTDGLRLAGSLFRTPRGLPQGLVLFCHELDSDRWSAPVYCEGLLEAGFHVLAFDFRNQGDSDSMPGYEPMHWPTTFEVDDVRAAVSYIAARPDLRSLPLAVFGMSRGGVAALVAAAGCRAIRGVVTDGAFSCKAMLAHYTSRWGRLYFPQQMLIMLPRWHVMFTLWLIRAVSELRRGCRYANVEGALRRLRDKPLLMISGERDTYVKPEFTLGLFARTGRDESGVWIVPGAKHNMARETATAEYDRRLVEFFRGLERQAGQAARSGTRPARELPR